MAPPAITCAAAGPPPGSMPLSEAILTKLAINGYVHKAIWTLIEMERHIAYKKVKEIMTKEVVTVSPETDLRTLKDMFEQYDFNSFPVVDKGKMVGIVSKLDLLKAFSPGLNVSLGRALKLYSKDISDIMHTATIFVGPNDDVSSAADYMVEFKLRSMPVMERGVLKGMVSRKDIIRCLEID
ncbi:MAG: CBS domain-containing protein [Euryarchaeota archaeon]|nr:CBS domain-containing protein [Euryarchaeota archaeon]